MKSPLPPSPLTTLAACFGLIGVPLAAEPLDRTILPLSQVLKIGGKPVSFGLIGAWYPEAPASTPDLGLRFVFTFLLPKN